MEPWPKTEGTANCCPLLVCVCECEGGCWEGGPPPLFSHLLTDSQDLFPYAEWGMLLISDQLLLSVERSWSGRQIKISNLWRERFSSEVWGLTIIWNHLNYFKFYFTWIPNTCPLWCIIYFFLHFQYLNIYNVLMWCPVEHWLGVDVFRSYFTSDMECPQYRMQMTATTRGNCGAGIDCLNKSVTLLWRGLVFDTWVSEENSVSRCQGQMAKHRTSAQSHGVDVSVEMTVKVHLQHDDVHTFIH